MIAGPNSEDTLHWCLRSVLDVADEIVIADCGMSAEALRIASSYAKRVSVRIVKGVDPKQEGFETARNRSLDACSMDWVLWIDTDEKLVGKHALGKYLRRNAFSGYGLRQHHFAVDTSFKPDMPVRLFRRGQNDEGKRIRFWGMIHEHPEYGVNEGPGAVTVISDANIAHVGYINEDVRKGRFVRNFPLLKRDAEKYPERLLTKHFIMRDNIHLIRFALQQNGGAIDEGIREKAREVIAIYRDNFLGKGHYMNADSLGYYSEAVGILGEGFDTAFQIVADTTEAKPNGVDRYRFATPEDFKAEIMRRAGDVVDRFGKEHF
jgi:glycosyltransferase involved in cell wall biosynthesis